jgi:hypothetical protein
MRQALQPTDGSKEILEDTATDGTISFSQLSNLPTVCNEEYYEDTATDGTV